ncbi:MAG TPA: M23 family metallopeptidase [Spirochaetia bacterium]|nr:M23 family metallopeptidase [Spirochaetia bacterium]
MPRKAMRSLPILVFLFAALTLVAGEASYTIREGETLFSVARRAQIPVDVLCAYNGIDNASKLKAGSIIRFPSLYVVKKGDTLFAISRSYGVPVAKLLELNGLNESSMIKIGSKLYIPVDRGAPAPQSIEPIAERTQQQESVARTSPSQDTFSQPTGSDTVMWPHAGRREPLKGKITGLVFFGSEGDPVHSATNGEVKWVGPYWGWGKTVIIKAADGDIILYAGNEQLLVNVGDRVSPGTEIARLGISPQGGGAKLYFSIQGANGQFVDPEKYFSGKSHA